MNNYPPQVKQELDALEIQFGSKSYLTLDDYSALYGISRITAPLHLRRKGIPYSKEGGELYVSILDLAIYKAKNKVGGSAPLIASPMSYSDEMKRRRGFNQMAEQKKYNL